MADCMFVWLLARSVWTIIKPIAVIVVLFLVHSPLVVAQDAEVRRDFDSPGLVVEAVAGWGGIVDRTAPVPLSFLFRNDSDQNIEGILTLAESLNGHEVNLGEVSIAPGTTRRFTSIQSMTNWFECVATFSRKGKILWRHELDLLIGKRTDRNINSVLFVDEGGRHLQLPGAITEVNAIPNPDFDVAGLSGRPIRCLTVKTWQLPNHPGPLITAQAMVFPEGASERDLNTLQWTAIADWMCQGGTIFVHDKSREIINRLVESAALGSDVAVPSPPFTVRRFGLGAVYEYTQPLLASGVNEMRQAIAETAATLKRNHINTFADAGYITVMRGGQADQNRLYVGVFFVFYTFMSGVVTLLLFRLSQKKIATYTVFIVVGASIFSALLGGFLRSSQGDLRWVSVTQAGIGGAVQVGTIEVQSAGSRNSLVAIKGEHADLQLIEQERFAHPIGKSQQTGYSPFTWQRNLATGEEDCYQINVPMMMWGRRRCHAAAFKRGLQPIDFEVDFKPRESSTGNQQESRPGTQGTVSIKLLNRLPFDLKDCWLVIGITREAPQQPVSPQANRRERTRIQSTGPQGATAAIDGMIDVYHVQPLQDLPAHVTREESFEANFQSAQHQGGMARFWPDGSQIPPRISRMGTASAWIIGRTENPAIIAIDELHSDFSSNEHVHLFIQEILPENMPDTLQFKSKAFQ